MKNAIIVAGPNGVGIFCEDCRVADFQTALIMLFSLTNETLFGEVLRILRQKNEQKPKLQILLIIR